MSEHKGGPLAGVRVIELGSMIAGPYSATLLADFGAEVIKVEAPGTGDPMRQMSPFVEGESTWWMVEGRNKRSITLNLRTAAGQDLLREMIPHCDLLIENFRPGTMERWGLGYSELSAISPKLVMLSVSGYGQSGPMSSKPAYDRMAQAFSGVLNMTGFPDRPPVRPGIAIADYGTAIVGAFAAMMGLYHRDAHGGSGQHIDVAMYEAMFRLTDNLVLNHDVLGMSRERTGNMNPKAAPGDHFVTSDGRYLVVTVSSDAVFGKLCRAMGREDLATDARFSTHEARSIRLGEINGIVGDWIRTLTAAEAGVLLDKAQQPYSLVYSVEDIMKDPHYAARNSIATVQHPRLGPIKMQAVSPQMMGTPAPAIRAAPDLGADTDDVYQTLLGKSKADIERLRRDGVV
jgi:crotonobetainyl-CoA:carnitine CoA-transferase CaiB-like acyl-CoA transferase